VTLLLSTVADVTIVLALALALVSALRARSAALRHSILAAAIVASMALPLLELALPQLPVLRWAPMAHVTSSGLEFTSSEAVQGSTTVADAAAAKAIPWTAVLLGIWLAGAFVTLAGLLTGFVRLARLTARCAPVESGPWRDAADRLSLANGIRRRVRLLQSGDRTLLVTCGVLRPSIILPAGASDWSDERRRIVVAHELAHIRRHDGAIQIAAEVLRACHWFNPLVWVACGRLRQESEYASDDAVLREGVEGAQYATHLLEVARHANGARRVWAPVPAIAEPSSLERRVAAMLSHRRNRAPVTRGAIAAVALAAAALAIPVAVAGVPQEEKPKEVVVIVDDGGSLSVAPFGTAAPPAARAAVPVPAAAQLEPATFSGAVLDQTGAALPGVRVDLTDAVTATLRSWTDAAGRFGFRDLPASQYQVVFQLPGFATVTNVLTLSSGSSARRIITMPIGTLQETITVVCGGQADSGAPGRRVLLTRPRQPGYSVAHHMAAFERLLSRMLDTFVPALSAQEPSAQRPVRVGGNLQAPRKVADARPVCPSSFVPGTETVVMLSARIGVDGHMNDVKAIPAEPGSEAPAEFVESSLAAVRHWTFTPTLLNGTAVDAMMNVRVRYRRE
jgi:beta-lactamase regulating signal transducer with metallopeptidase domain